MEQTLVMLENYFILPLFSESILLDIPGVAKQFSFFFCLHIISFFVAKSKRAINLSCMLFLIPAVPLLTYLLTKSDLQMEEATLSSVIMFRAGVEVVR